MKKSITAQELRNTFPPWSRTRNDDTSVGARFLSALSAPMDYTEEQLTKMRANYYVPSFNVGEIDKLYKISLPSDFPFEIVSLPDSIHDKYVTPDVVGHIGSNAYTVSEVENNSLYNLWYDSLPNRLSVSFSEVIDPILIVTAAASDAPFTGIWKNPTSSGELYIRMEGGTRYLDLDSNTVRETIVEIEGLTQEGTVETEQLVFPWPEVRSTITRWDTVFRVSVWNASDGTSISVSFSQFNTVDLKTNRPQRQTEDGHFIDESIRLGANADNANFSTLVRTGFVHDNWKDVIKGFFETEDKEYYDLIDDLGAFVSGIDITYIPFTNRCVILDQTGKLFFYDLFEVVMDDPSLLDGQTVGANALMEVESRSVLLNGTMFVIPWLGRVTKDPVKYRISYRTPSGLEFGYLNGSVPITGDYWIAIDGRLNSRQMGPPVELIATEHGDWVFTLETEYEDGTVEISKQSVRVNSKIPLKVLDTASYLSSSPYGALTPVGIDMGNDQSLTILARDSFGDEHLCSVTLAYDVMLIDYEQKLIYTRELYDSVTVTTNA